MPFTSAPALLPRHISWSKVRSVTPHRKYKQASFQSNVSANKVQARAFQLQANRVKSKHPGCVAPNVHASCQPPSLRTPLRRCFSAHQPFGLAKNVKGSEEEMTLESQRDGQTLQAIDRNDSEAPGACLLEPSAREAGPTTVPFPSYTEGESHDSTIQHTMRRYMRRVPQSAVIVTATNINDTQNPSRGATVSSFTTVTFEPEVIVSLNLKLPSATFDAIESSNWFDVKMLKSNHVGAAAASRFARGHVESPFGKAGRGALMAANRSSKQLPLAAPPLLYKGHGIKNPVAFHLTCLYMREKSVHLGDHIVVFGIVKRIPGRSDKHLEGESCLAYVDGCYGSVKPFSSQPEVKSDKLNVSPIFGKAGIRDDFIKGEEKGKRKREVERTPEVCGLSEGGLRRDAANECFPPHEYAGMQTVNLASSFVVRPESSADNDKPYFASGEASKSSISKNHSTNPIRSKLDAEYRHESNHSVQEAEHGKRDSTVARFWDQSATSTSALVPTPMLPSAPLPIMPFWGFTSTRRYSQSTKGMRYTGNLQTSTNTAGRLSLATRSLMLPPPASRATRRHSAGSPTAVGPTISADRAAVDHTPRRSHINNPGRKASSAVRSSESQFSEEGVSPPNRSIYPIIKKIVSDSKDHHLPADGANVWSFVRTESPDQLPIRKLALRDLVRFIPRDDVGIRKFVYEKSDSPGPDSDGRYESVDAVNEVTESEPQRQARAKIRKLYVTNDLPRRRKLRTRKQRGYSPRERLPLRSNQSSASSPSRYQVRLGGDNTATLTNDARALIDAILQGIDQGIDEPVRTRPSYSKSGKQSKHSLSLGKLPQEPRPHVGGAIHKVPCGPQNENEISLPQLATTEAMRRDIEDVKDQIQKLFLKR
jgi:Flavin reductase like domain